MHQSWTVIQTVLSFDRDSQGHQISAVQWSALGCSGKMRQGFGAKQKKNKQKKSVLTVLLPFQAVEQWRKPLTLPLLWKILTGLPVPEILIVMVIILLIHLFNNEISQIYFKLVWFNRVPSFISLKVMPCNSTTHLVNDRLHVRLVIHVTIEKWRPLVWQNAQPCFCCDLHYLCIMFFPQCIIGAVLMTKTTTKAK